MLVVSEGKKLDFWAVHERSPKVTNAIAQMLKRDCSSLYDWCLFWLLWLFLENLDVWLH
ncbi:MAG: hypothetical protein AB1861_22590 [Cyanobacteriota bacterium]